MLSGAALVHRLFGEGRSLGHTTDNVGPGESDVQHRAVGHEVPNLDLSLKTRQARLIRCETDKKSRTGNKERLPTADSDDFRSLLCQVSWSYNC